MFDSYDDDLIVLPDTITYNSVINAYANLGFANQAENILNDMYRNYKNGENINAKPDVISFNTVLSGWSKYITYTESEKNKNYRRNQLYINNAPERAMSILERMKDLNNHEDENSIIRKIDCQPDSTSYNVVIDCWAKAKRHNSGKQAELLCKQMEFPNTITYNTVINAYTNQGKANEAERVLKEMYQIYKKNKENCHPGAVTKLGGSAVNAIEPNVKSFNTVLSGWSKSRKKDAPNRVMGILKLMNNLNHTNVKPDVISYNAVIDCWAKAKRKNSGQQAEAILRKMQTKKDSKNQIIQPNTITYNSVINAYALVGNATRAESILNEFYNRYIDNYNDRHNNNNNNKNVAVVAKPDIRSFNTVLSGWSKSRKKDAPNRVMGI